RLPSGATDILYASALGLGCVAVVRPPARITSPSRVRPAAWSTSPGSVVAGVENVLEIGSNTSTDGPAGGLPQWLSSLPPATSTRQSTSVIDSIHARPTARLPGATRDTPVTGS